MRSCDGVTAPVRYGKTWTVTHDPLRWRETADAFLEEPGVRVLYHCPVVCTVLEGEEVPGIVAESKDGRGAVSAKLLFDASGDAEVTHRAGTAFTVGRDGTCQNPPR